LTLQTNNSKDIRGKTPGNPGDIHANEGFLPTSCLSTEIKTALTSTNSVPAPLWCSLGIGRNFRKCDLSGCFGDNGVARPRTKNGSPVKGSR
jgi:hypothetical protein